MIHSVKKKMERGNMMRQSHMKQSEWLRTRLGGEGKCSEELVFELKISNFHKVNGCPSLFSINTHPNVSTSCSFIALVYYFQIFEVPSFWQGFFVNSSVLIWCLKGRLVRFIFIWNSSLLPFFFSVCLCQLHQQTALENMFALGAWDFSLCEMVS